MCVPDHQKVSPAGSSPCRQSYSNLFHARSECCPVTLQRLSSGFEQNHSLHTHKHHTHTEGKFYGKCTALTHSKYISCSVSHPYQHTYLERDFTHMREIFLSFFSYTHTCAVHTADTVCMLQIVFVQVYVQTKASSPITTNPLELGQVHWFIGGRPSSIALRDTINRGHALTGRSVGGASLGT